MLEAVIKSQFSQSVGDSTRFNTEHLMVMLMFGIAKMASSGISVRIACLDHSPCQPPYEQRRGGLNVKALAAASNMPTLPLLPMYMSISPASQMWRVRPPRDLTCQVMVLQKKR